jgi:hypothetical protein
MARPVTDPSFREYKVRLGDVARERLDRAATDFADANGKEAAQAELIRWVVEQYAGQSAVSARSDAPTAGDASGEVDQLRAEVASLRIDLDRARAATLAAMQRDHGTRSAPPGNAYLSAPATAAPLRSDTARVTAERIARQRGA